MNGYLLFVLLALKLLFVHSFNVDVDHPSIFSGPANSYFGFSLAQHFQNGRPKLLVGAIRDQSGQPGTEQAGSVYSCDVLTPTRKCEQLQVEYPTESEFRKPPQRIGSKLLHKEGKNHQLLGFVVQSSGTQNGSAMVCAPLMRYGEYAYTDGVCYLLQNDLTHSGLISTCNPLPKKDRHNDYGACEQGFSGFMDENVILTGLPGARKWTGGVFGRYLFKVDGFWDSVDRWTMEVSKQQNGIINLLASHDYLGYSVRYGRFGFWYEEESRENFTIVSGATRYAQTGAAMFLPFRKRSRPEEERLLGLDDEPFKLLGYQLGSGFGYSIEVLDLNKDGFDDLIVSAPFEFHSIEDIEFSGAVYIYYSNGRQQAKGEDSKVFREPIVLRGNGVKTQFGMSLAALGNIDGDDKHFEDFAVGVPFAENGQGAVFVYHGNVPEKFSTKPAQEIYASQLKRHPGAATLKTFGASLTGGVDLDGNGYPDLAVGAYESSLSFLLRTRPVVEVQLAHELSQKYIKINGGSACPSNYKTCLSLKTAIRTVNRNDTASILNLNEEPYQCELTIVPYAKGMSPRAIFKNTRSSSTSWPCGRYSIDYEQRQDHEVYVPFSNQDWIHPIRFNFTVRMTSRPRRDLSPIVRGGVSHHTFDASFDKKCGDDNDCYTDLSVKPILLNMTRTANGTYTSKVTERDSIVVRFMVENRKERAFFAKLYVTYNQDELDVPQLVNNAAGVDVERKEDGLAVIALGNPFEENQKMSFDMSFSLVRGSSERVSAELVFDVLVNSTSIEEYPADNEWRAEVKLIKEADLQLNGASQPTITRFSKGHRRVTDEEDIGPQVIHAYTLTNNGPFYAKNVTVTINWPLKLNTPGDEWILYVLEDPVVRYRRQIRKCKINPYLKAVNPLNIFNEESLKLAYSTYGLLRTREKRSAEERKIGQQAAETRHASILDYIRTKDVTESSGAKIKVVDINCKDGSAHCVPLTCHFDYIGTKESALIEIRARLWNYTFSADYQRIEYIAISSNGVVEVDPQQGIIEDIKNNFAEVTTQAYPDRPHQDQKLDWWLIVLAVIVGLVLFAIVAVIAYKCGFFKRKRPDRGMLHTAEYKHQHEMYG
ncbi:FG-GAP repeat protein [Aphelenchoides bicaudatus]|nr:FG-GAP repeat protein [Aphelenchoides bicaudatus]